jgi:hypothetical protein
VLSNSKISAKDRFTIDGDIENMKGELVAKGSADLWDENLENAVRYDEAGNDIASQKVWTGSLWNGEPAFGTQNCSDWDSRSGLGSYGFSDQNTAHWLFFSDIGACNTEARLYCLNPAIATPPTSENARVFVSSETYTGNLGGRTGADAKCQSLAEVAEIGGTWVAILSDSVINAKDRIIFTGELLNMADEVVASSATDLWDETIQHSINYTEKGILADSGTVWSSTDWTGKADNGSGTMCNNWTSESGVSGTAAIGSTNAHWIWKETKNCSNSYRIYCFSGN